MTQETRKSRALALRQILERGPSTLNSRSIGPLPADPEELRKQLYQCYTLWLKTWVLPELDNLVPELRHEAAYLRAVTAGPRELQIRMSAADWQLYSTMPGVEHAAYSLSCAVQGQINGSKTRLEAEQDVMRTLGEFAKWGANDTEPRAIARRLIDERFGSADRSTT